MTAPFPSSAEVALAQHDPAARERVDRAYAAWYGLTGDDAEALLGIFRAYDLRKTADRLRAVDLEEHAALADAEAALRERVAATRFALAGRYPDKQQGREAA